MILSGQLMLASGAGAVRLERGQVRLRGGQIAEVRRGDRPIGTADLGGEGAVICPGFIDAHVHLPQFDCIGVDGLTLMEWLERAVFPTEAAWVDADHAGAVTERVGRRLLSAGTTGIAAYATVHHEATRRAIDGLHAWGGRAMVGQVLMDQQAPAELVRPAAQLLAEAAVLRGVGRVEVAVTPRFAVSCSDALLRGCGELAVRTGWAVQTHVSETRGECSLVRELHGCESYAEVYRRAGLLTRRTVLGHGVWLSGEERAMVRDAGSVVAHCPTANLFLRAGTLDRGAMVREGVRLALGSDVAGGPDVCMVRVARAMIEAAKVCAMDAAGEAVRVPTAAEAWGQITLGNATALGWGDCGRLEAGCAADVVVLDPSRGPAGQHGWARAVEPLSALLYGFDERWITRTIVQGRVAYSA